MKKEGWEIKKLEEVGIIVTGNTPKTSVAENYDSEDICFVKPSDISNKGISLLSTTENYISEFARGQARILPIGSVLVTCIGIIGKTAVLEKEAATNQQINSVIPSENIISKFLAYALLGARDTLNHMSNAPVVPIINKTQFASLSISIPPLPIQEQIVKELDTLSDIIANKKEQLAKLDTLAQATFYDMFGDPVDNEKGWEMRKIREFSDIKIGPFGSALHVEDYVEDGIPLVNPSHMSKGKIICDSRISISQDKLKELTSYILKENDIVIGRRGEIGRCAIVTKKENGFICGTGSLFIRFTSVVNPLYFYFAFTSDSLICILVNQAKGATMLNLNSKIISNIGIPLPPLPLQNQFAERIEAIEKQKELINKSIVDVQLLFDYTMDKYFN